MTEYSTSAEAMEEYLNSQQRLRSWLTNVSSDDATLYSPNVAPSVMLPDPEWAPPPVSEAAWSSHSQPPKMVLRWPDGRPDVPIQRSMSKHTGSGQAAGTDLQPPPQSQSGSRHSRQPSSRHSKSHSHPPSSMSQTRGGIPPPIPSASSHHHPSIAEGYGLPQPSHHSSHHSTAHSRPSRSKSLPKHSDLQSMHSSHHTIYAPTPPIPMGNIPAGAPPPSAHTHHLSTTMMQPAPPPNATMDHRVQFTTPQWHTWSARHASGKRSPPAIIYAPSSQSQNYHYSPPPMSLHPPSHQPPGSVVYSHSAPNPPLSPWYATMLRHATPYPSAMGTAIASSHHSSIQHLHGSSLPPPQPGYVHAPTDFRSRSRSRTSATRVGDEDYSLVDAESDGSGSTYYVLPAQGQKVLVIAPEHSMITSPADYKNWKHQQANYTSGTPKKPFMQRLRDIKEVFTPGGSSKASNASGGRRLHRRHSADAARGQ